MKMILALAITLTAVAAHGQGNLSFTYDQQSSTNPFSSGGVGPFNNFQPYGQSFTPTLSYVGFVQLLFVDLNHDGQGATVYVNLRENSITGNILASTSPIFVNDAFIGVTNLFFSSPVSVTSNTTYFFQPVLQSGDTTLSILEDIYNYPGGSAFHFGAPTIDGDLWFREGIVVPKISIQLTNGKPLLRFLTFSNQNYSIEYAANFPSGSWSNLLSTNIQGTGQDIALTDTNVTMSINRFYRLKLSP